MPGKREEGKVRTGCGLRVIAVALGAAALAAACSPSTGGEGDRPSVPTRAATAAAPATAPAGTVRPTTATVPVTTAAPATAPGPTTTGAPVVVGPRPNTVTLVETPLATRRTGPAGGGALVELAHPAYDRAFLVAVGADEVATLTAGPGWTRRVVDTDPQWAPAAFAGTDRAFVARRWLAFVDETPAVAVDGQPSLGPVDRQLVVFDTATGALSSRLERPNGVRWFGSLVALDDRTVAVLFDPTPLAEVAADPVLAEVRDRLAVRRIDLVTGRTDDLVLALPPGYTYRSAAFDADGAVVVTTTFDELLRGPVGGALVPSEPPAVVTNGVADGVRLDAAATVPPDGGDARRSVRDGSGTAVAAFAPWRFAAPGTSLGLHGWSGGRAFVDAWRDEPGTVEAATAGPAAYDPATDTWDWAIAPDSVAARTVSGVGYVVVGTVPKPRAPS